VRVAVDARSLGVARGARGVARYLSCLLSELEAHFPDDYVRVERRGRAAYATAALAGRPRLDRAAGGCDVAWAPAPAPLALSSEIPLVLTVHDLSFEHRPQDFSAYERLWHRVARPRALARRAARVIAVSDAVRRQLIEEWGLEPDRVVTIRSGPGRPPPEAERPPPDAEHSGCFLAVGALEPRKRPRLLVEAHRIARDLGLRGDLVLAGEGPLAAKLEGPGVRLLGRVDDDRLDRLYASARALVIASREEGFGYTPLEAMARGTPVIAADLPPFAETLGEGALRLPRAGAEELAQAMLRLERDDVLHARLAAAGREAAGRLSWRRAAEQTQAVLAEAAA
jgi:glycosyltransferase involved in cell wall biosynthesis